MYKRIISRLDVKNGMLVKGINLEGLRNLGDPEHFSKIYYDQKIDEIHFQDIWPLFMTEMYCSILSKKSQKNFCKCFSWRRRSLDEVDKLLKV